MITRWRRTTCRCAAIIAGLGISAFATAPTVADVSLFTTTSDFTGWFNGAASQTSSSAFDYDGVTVNGSGNNPGNSGASINPGGTSTGGSLQLTDTNNLAFNVLASSPGEAYNNAFMSVLDPGSTTAYSAASGYGAGSTVAYSGKILLTYTVPTISSGNYLQIGVNFNYQAGGYYQPYFGTAVSDGTVGGLSTYTATIPYTITAGAGNLSNFQLGIQSNSDYVPTAPFYVDSIQIVSVPEPATALGLVAFGALSLSSRRKKS